jgi:hypothetical protein
MKKPGLISWVSGALLVLLLVLIAIHGGKWPAKKTPDNLPPAPPANMDTATPPPAVAYWQQKFPQYQLVKWAPGYLNGDDQEDAVIIYRTGSKCYLVAVIDLPGGFQVTDPVAAPVSDQQITIGDVENKNPNEIIVSGQKNGAYGYSIFALDKNQLLNLYSAGMDQCC